MFKPFSALISFIYNSNIFRIIKNLKPSYFVLLIYRNKVFKQLQPVSDPPDLM